MSTDTTVPNHHATHPGFSGPLGALAALTMLVGRTEQADLARELTHLGLDDDLVDIGCGPGVAARRAARVARSVTGVDPAPVMLRTARLLGRGVRWVEGTAEDLPLDDGSASVVWALATVHHWHDIDRAVDEVARVLRPGGRFLAVERLADPHASGHAGHGWAPHHADAFAAACEAHGFVDVSVSRHDLRHRPCLAVLARRPDGRGSGA